jgi:choline dehydrogenase
MSITNISLRTGLLVAVAGVGLAMAGGCEGNAGTDVSASEGCEGKCDDLDPIDSPYEFVIVGSGAGGGPLAANLARNGHSVLLLEAGQDAGDNINYQVPAFHGKSTEDPEMRWDFFVKHYSDPNVAARDSKLVVDEQTGEQIGVLYPRAGTLGGCTAHNAMITVTAHDQDWNAIAQATGDPSWSAANMQPYFEDVRRWLEVSPPDPGLALFDHAIQHIVLGATTVFSGNVFGGIAQATTLLNRDINDERRAETDGIYGIPMATRDGARNGTREYLLQTVAEGYPLTIQTGSLVTRVVFAEDAPEPHAIGVEYLQGEHLYRADPNAGVPSGAPQQVFATREVILAAGAFNTPQLLKLSGIGPRTELESFGIEVRADLPGVGENLQDRYEVGILHELRGDFSTGSDCTFGDSPDDPCLMRWKEGREGVYTSNGAVIAIVKRSRPGLPSPDLFIFGTPGNFIGYEPGYSKKAVAERNKFTWLVLKAHTDNIGSVRLRSVDPLDPPEINFQYFGDNAPGADPDLDAIIAGINYIRDIAGQTRALMFAPLFGRFDEIWPGDDVRSAAALGQFVRDEAWGHHASCTAKIGADDDPMAVLDSEFRVRGVEGLRVVDASVFPDIPGFFIVAPTYMISEKATDAILSSLGETRIEANRPQ